jgi:four helix bundle suffix protein
LRLDYEDFLRQRGLPLWQPDHPALVRFKASRCATVEEVSAWVEDEHRRTQTNTNERRQVNARSVSVRGGRCQSVGSSTLVVNAALSLLNLCCYRLDRQLAAQAQGFEKEGGFTERLYRTRQQTRRNT